MPKKSYFDIMEEITKEELFEGLLGHGMFAAKIPPFLTSKPFCDFCMNQKDSFFEKKEKGFIQYENMRNINVPRALAIPNPIAYRNICHVLSDNWEDLLQYFKDKTKGHLFKISRIHIRKLDNSKTLFEMGYEDNEGIEYEDDEEIDLSIGNKHLFEMNSKDFYTDDYPEPDLLIGKHFIVKADISNCFPSIYTHSIPWALVGKEHSKKHRDDKEWFNKLDKFTRNLKDAETHGILIGPHASNLVSEIILVSVDDVMYKKGYSYIRNIDDYSFYAKSHQEAEKFLVDLTSELKKFSLTLNHKKTEILKLPLASTAHWVRKINTFVFTNENRPLKRSVVRSYLDIALDLMQKNNENSAIVNYVVKVLSAKKLTNDAKSYYIKTMHHLILIYPYLIHLLEDNIFKPFGVEIDEIKKITLDIFEIGKAKNLFEAKSYALYFAIKYQFSIEQNLYDVADNSRDCIFMLLAFLYDKKLNASQNNIKKYKVLAEELSKNEMDQYWLFLYEVLPKSKLNGHWKTMKESNISFIKDDFYALL